MRGQDFDSAQFQFSSEAILFETGLTLVANYYNKH